MARASERHAEPFSDVAQRELLEADQFEGRALPFGQLIEAGAQEPPALLSREQRLRQVRAARAHVEQLDRLAAIRRAALQVGLAAQRAVVGVLQQPHFHRTALGIVEVGLARDLEEHFLGDVFRFGGIAQDIRGDAVNETGVAAQEQIERVVAGAMQVGDQLRVGFGHGAAGAFSGPASNGGTARQAGGTEPSGEEDAHDGYLTSVL